MGKFDPGFKMEDIKEEEETEDEDVKEKRVKEDKRRKFKELVDMGRGDKNIRQKKSDRKDDKNGKHLQNGKVESKQSETYLSPNLMPDKTLYASSFDTTKLTNISPTTSPKPSRVPVIVLSDNQVENGQQDLEEDLPRRRSSRIMTFFLWFIFVVLYIVFFIVILFVYSKEHEEDYWCEGDGFLIILTSVIVILLLYFKIFKPLLGKRFQNRIAKPIGMKIEFYLNRWYVVYLLYATAIGLLSAYLIYDTARERERLFSVLGLCLILGVSYVFSSSKSKIKWRTVLWGVTIQYIIGYLTIKWYVGQATLKCFGKKVHVVATSTDAGTKIIFGDLSSVMKILAFKFLPIIMVVKFCMNILLYYGIVQFLARKLGWFLQVTLKVTALESINGAYNLVLPMVEAPLMVKRFLPMMTKSELHAIMTEGFATLAMGLTTVYISLGIDMGSLLSAGLMNIPAAIVISKIILPETDVSRIRNKDIQNEKREREASVLEAGVEGVLKSRYLVMSLLATLIVTSSFFALVDVILNWGCSLVNVSEGVCSVSNFLGQILMPLSWVLGIPWNESYVAGRLIGTKILITEFLAYAKLSVLKETNIITKRSEMILTYALSGFSNLTSAGMTVKELGSLVPDRKGDITKSVISSLFAGTMASLLSACVAGSLLRTFNEHVSAEVSSQLNIMSFNITS